MRIERLDQYLDAVRAQALRSEPEVLDVDGQRARAVVVAGTPGENVDPARAERERVFLDPREIGTELRPALRPACDSEGMRGRVHRRIDQDDRKSGCASGARQRLE